MRRFYVNAVGGTGEKLVLDRAETNHLRRVLRLCPGDAVVLFDGTGKEVLARVDRFFDDRAVLFLERQQAGAAESRLAMTLVQGYLKEGKMDTLVRQSTELGVVRFIPFFSERSVPSPAEGKLNARMSRWERIARESLKQCRRNRLPIIGPASGIEDVIALTGDADVKIVFWEKAEVPLARIAADCPPAPGAAAVLLGPEGGLTDAEIRRLSDAGFSVAGLGPRILRAETATVAACALVQYLFGDMGSKAEGGRQKAEGADRV